LEENGEISEILIKWELAGDLRVAEDIRKALSVPADYSCLVIRYEIMQLPGA
jgi:hypothetical protein